MLRAGNSSESLLKSNGLISLSPSTAGPPFCVGDMTVTSPPLMPTAISLTSKSCTLKSSGYAAVWKARLARPLCVSLLTREGRLSVDGLPSLGTSGTISPDARLNLVPSANEIADLRLASCAGPIDT